MMRYIFSPVLLFFASALTGVAGPLGDAAKNGDTAQIAQLLDGSADVNEPGFATPLQLAAMFGHLDAVTLLIDRGADVDAWSSAIGTSLHTAAQSGHAQVLSAILGAGANPNARDGNEYTPLMTAAKSGHPNAVRALLEGGADYSLVAEVKGTQLGGRGKVTALHLAKNFGKLDAADELIRAGASPKPPASVAEAIGDADPAHGRKAALQWCGNCHVVESEEIEGKPFGNYAGPTLVGIFGRQSASDASYELYTDALQQVDWVWNEDRLFAFSNEAMLTVPGTRMRYRDDWTEHEVADIVAYFKSVAD